MQHTLKNEINCHPTKGMFKIIAILLFCFFCNAMSSTVLTCLAHASSFVCRIWISIYTSATRAFEKYRNVDAYIRPYTSYTSCTSLVLQLDIISMMTKDLLINWAAKEIYIQQLNIYKKSLYEDVYIRPWLLAWKYFGRTLNSKRTYIYVFGCWRADRVGAGREHQGRIYTSLAVGKNSLGTQRVNNKETRTTSMTSFWFLYS